MRLVTYLWEGTSRLGALAPARGDEVVFDLNHLDPRLPADMIGFLSAGEQALALARQALAAAKAEQGLPLASVRLLAPVPRPGKIFCVGQNYLDHALEGNAPELKPYPILFSKFANTIIGSGEPIVIPPETTGPDYEGELAVIIGRRARRVPEDRALEVVGGYCPLNDVSARDWQKRTSQWDIGKTFDTFAPMGPALVTADEVPDPQALTLRTRINGELLQEASTGRMIFSVAHLIAYISQVVTLEPGDVIATGTPSGVGYARTPPRWLRHGDVVQIEVEGVGVLSNPVVFGS